MHFKLTPAFSQADFQKDIDKIFEIIFKETRNVLIQIGLEFVNDARLKAKSQGGFDDQTGNLRSSIGFMLYYNGESVLENFKASPSGNDKDTGIIEGRNYAKQLTDDNPNGWLLVTVAGMEYASFVEAKGYDVITGSTSNAQTRLKRAYSAIVNK